MNEIKKWFRKITLRFPYVTEENFYRILLLYYGTNYNNRNSFPDYLTHYELIFKIEKLSFLPILTFLNRNSPFTFIDASKNQKILLYKNQFIDRVKEYEEKFIDLKKPEPSYFYVNEINNDLVLKVNPVQLCNFYQNPSGEKPCQFCFRNDMISRFRNISANNLVKKIIFKEKQEDQFRTLNKINELSIITGSYQNDKSYIKEITTLIKGLKPYLPKHARIVVGSHEGKTTNDFESFKMAGVTVFAFPVESLDDGIRTKIKWCASGSNHYHHHLGARWNLPLEEQYQRRNDAGGHRRDFQP